MRVPALDNRRTAAYAQCFRREGDSETRQRAAELRRQHEQATAQLRARLPFAWQVGKVRPRYQGPSFWEHAPAAIHIQLLEAVMLAPGTKQAQARAAGDWLCQAALDTSSGEVRYEPEAAPDHCDGTGGPAAYYRPMPSCKNCLKKAQQLFPNPLPPTMPNAKSFPRRRTENAAEAKTLREWLTAQVGGITREQWHQSYCSWARGGHGWGQALRWDGGTTIRYCLAWYQYRHKPGSKEWRPSVIVEAVCLAAGLNKLISNAVNT